MGSQIKIIIVDDEYLAREIIKKYLSAHKNINIVSECSNGFEAVKEINEKKPDIIFLDIQMPKLSGFEMLELLDDPPVIIFTTAFDQYALKAFEVNAVDYLLKPFSDTRFAEALEKALSRLRDKSAVSTSINNLIEHNDKKREPLERVVVKEGQKITIVPINTIRWIEAQDDYVMLHAEGGKFIKKKTMRFFEDHLEPNTFIRIHRSSIININFIKQMEVYEKDSYRVILKNDKPLPVSKTGLQKLKQIL